MTPNKRLWIRRASAIHEQMTTNRPRNGMAQMPQMSWREAERLLHRIDLAQRRGWRHAASRQRQALRSVLRQLRNELFSVERQHDPNQTATSVPSIRDILGDLMALHEEFEEVSFESREETISVTTQSIELEGVYLGYFEIRLEWGGLPASGSVVYRVIARDPQPAGPDPSVTHPHVQDELLCEGEGRLPLQNALEEGRLYDFFMIVASLLRTYNAGSPHVGLNDWFGVDCPDCGATVMEDERWTCEKCEATACENCYFSCPGCKNIFCSQCVSRCEGCEEYYCSNCLKYCSDCGTECCQSCLDDEGKCEKCHAKKTERKSEGRGADGAPGGDHFSVASI